MLPRSSRVGRKAFPAIMKGRVFHSAHFSLRAVSSEKPRFSMVISKKVAAKAVTRNLLKRRGMAIIEVFIKKSHAPLSAIVFAKKGAAELGFASLKDELMNLLSSLPSSRH